MDLSVFYGYCTHTRSEERRVGAVVDLDRLCRLEGVPPEMIMDGSKEQNLGDFARKLRDDGCHKQQIEPHSPWMNLCEGEIRELKRGSTREMLNQNAHKKLWDHCFELGSSICYATILPRIDLDHQTLEAKMHDMSSEISDICEFEFY